MFEKVLVGLIVALAAAWLIRRKFAGGGCGCGSSSGCCSSGSGKSSSGCSCQGGSIGEMRPGGGCGCSKGL
ncbi:hypothetical protein [Fundidesulfovibrio agrisoli]|uniref:hypothetical protein n=1 Tax=Fundidesulfovibrio agrisoli TaxID=2922717 RepID=UPI001FADE5FE|nr:hypothetical protein [Fundidesulfovibrio agrisoli]